MVCSLQCDWMGVFIILRLDGVFIAMRLDGVYFAMRLDGVFIAVRLDGLSVCRTCSRRPSPAQRIS